MSRKVFSSPLRHEGSPPNLTKGPEHDEWHNNYSTIEDSPEYVETDLEKITKQASDVRTTEKQTVDKKTEDEYKYGFEIPDASKLEGASEYLEKIKKEKEEKEKKDEEELLELKKKYGVLGDGSGGLSTYRKHDKLQIEKLKKIKDFEESGVLEFDDFHNILLGPDGLGARMQDSPFGWIATEERDFADLESYVAESLTKIHKGKVIDGHTFTFSSGKSGFLGLDFGDYLHIHKINKNGKQVGEKLTIPLQKTGGLTAETQHKQYIEFMYPDYDKDIRKEDVVNTWVDIAEKYMGENDYWKKLYTGDDAETYNEFIERATPKQYMVEDPASGRMVLGSPDGSAMQAGNIVYRSTAQKGNRYQKLGFPGLEPETQKELRLQYNLMVEISKRTNIAEEIFTNIVGGGMTLEEKPVGEDEIIEKAEAQIRKDYQTLNESEQVAFTSEEDYINWRKIAWGPNGKPGGGDDIEGIEIPGFKSTLEYINKENEEAIANITALLQVDQTVELAKWESELEEETEKIIAENDEEIRGVINYEFGSDIDLIEADYVALNTRWGNQEAGMEPSKEVNDMFQARFNENYNTILQEVREDKFRGDDPEIREEAIKRAQEQMQGVKNFELEALADKHKSKLDEIQSRQKDLEDSFLTDLNTKYQEAWDLYWNGDEEKGVVGVSQRYFDKYAETSDHYDELIDDDVFDKLGDKLHDMKFHNLGTSYKTKKVMLGQVWNDYKLTLPEGLSEGEIENYKQEFMFRVASKINFGKNGLSKTAIITEATNIKKELEAKDKLTGDEKDLLRIAEDILDKPQNFSKWGVVNFWEGLTSKRAEYWIPIAGSMIDGYRQSEIRDIIEMQQAGEELSPTQESILMLYQGQQQIEQSLADKSTGYTVGSGTIDTLKFMAEMMLTRGIGRGVGTASKWVIGVDKLSDSLRITNNSLRGYTAAQRSAAGYSQFKYGSMVVGEKAIKTWEMMWNTLGMTVTGGSGQIYSNYQMRMTPELAYAISDAGEGLDFEVKKLGYWDPATKTFSPDADPIETGLKAFGTTYTEFITEKAGYLLPVAGKFLKDKALFRQVVLSKYLKKIRFNPATQDMLATIKQAGGYNGMLAEVFEEILAQPIQNWIDGNNLTEGMDWETFYKPVIIQTGIFQVAFMGGNKVYKMAKGIKDPVYHAGGVPHANEENMIAHIRHVMGENDGVLPKDFEIRIDNDYSTFRQVENLLKNTRNSNIEITSGNLEIEVTDGGTALEIEATNDLGTEKVKEVEEMNSEIDKLKEEQKQLEEEIDILNKFGTATEVDATEQQQYDADTYVMPGPKPTTESKKSKLNKKINSKQTQTILDKISNIKRKINSITTKKKDILQPIIEKINKNKTTPKYQKGLDNIKKFLNKIDPFTSVLEMDNDQDTEAFAKENQMELEYKKKGVQKVVNAETGKTTYIDIQTNQTLGKTDLIERGVIEEGMEFDQRGIGVDIVQMEVDQWAKSEDFSGVHGFTGKNIDGKDFIVINKNAAIKLGASNVAYHEVLHRFLNKTFKDHPNTQLAIGNALEQYLLDLNPKQIQNSDLRKKIAGYQQQQGIFVSAEETLTLFSDAIAKGEITFNETVFTKVGDMFRRAFSAAGMKVEFDSGRSVMNFVKDYNRAMESGTMSAGMRKTFKEGAKITGRMKQGSDGYAESLVELGYEQNKDGSFKSVRDGSGLIQFSKDIDMYKDSDLFTPETLVEIIKSPSSTEIDVRGATEALTNKDGQGHFDFLALEAINYDTRAGDIPRANVVSAARAELPGIIKRFDPTTSKFSTYVTNTMRPKAQQIYEEAKNMAFEMTSLDSPLVQELADTTVETKKDDTKDMPKTDVLKFDKVSDKVSDITNVVKVKKGDTFKQITDKHTGKVGEIVFNVPSQKITDPKKNLTYAKKIKDGIPEPSEAGNIQQFYTGNNLGKTIRILPPLNVSSKDADINKIGENIDVARDVYGTSLGLHNGILKYFYQPKLKADGTRARSQGKTSQVGLWELKPEFKNPTSEVIEQVRKDLGITPRGELNKYDRGIGQRLKGLAFFQSQQTALSTAQRILEKAKADKKQIASITAAQSKLAFSKEIIRIVENADFNIDKTLNQVLNMFGVESAYELKTKEEIDEFVKATKKYLLPLMPRDFWFGQPAFFDIREIKKETKRFGDTFYEMYNLDINKVKPLLENAIKKDDNNLLRKIIRDNDIKTWGTEFTPGVRSKATNYEIYQTYFKPEMQKLRNLPDNAFGADVDGVKDFSRVAYSTIFKNEKTILANIKNGSIDEFNNKVSKIHSALWSRINETIKDDKKSARVIGNYLKLTASQSNHWHKLGAQFVGWSPKPVGKYRKGKLVTYEYEHAMPATAAYLYLLHTSLGKSNFSASYKAVMDNYKLIALDANQNEKLNNAGLARTMPKGWNLNTDFWWNRYFNEAVFNVDGIGIDPRNIMHTSGKTFAEEFGINAEGKSTIVKTKVRSKTKYSKAINNSRAININTESNGMSAWDFDDTLARTKSGVRYTLPNPSGEPAPGRKVIFLAGGAGSGKSNVIKQLGLEKQGFKIVNQDISLEWLVKNSGLPTDMRDFTPEQASKWGSLQWEARDIAQRKQTKFQGKGDGIIVDGTGASSVSMSAQVRKFKSAGYDVQMVFVETSLDVALERNKAREERSLKDFIVERNHKAVMENKKGFKELFGERFAEVNTDNLKQGDPMPKDLISKLDTFTRGYIKGRLNAGEYASKGTELKEQGAEFDFSEFNVVTEGEVGPMFKTAMDRSKKFGTKDTYVLTARPPEAAKPIHEFLKSQGLNIPIENITGLGNSTGEAKAEWMLEKFSEGYNNMFFADDALQNVEAVRSVLDQLDIKSKVVQAKIKFSKDMQSTVDEVLDDPQLTEVKNQSSINDVKNIDRLSSPGVYSNIKFSKKHRGEYENIISKHRPDLVKEGKVSQTIDAMFDYIDNLNIPNDKKRKYEQITTKWLATSNIKLNEDGYKIQEAVELAEKYKEDIFSYTNPNQIIEKYAGKVKVKPTDPKTVKEFAKETVTNKKHGITEHVVENTKEGQLAVRKVMDTHFGENSNPWCLAQKKNGKLTEGSQKTWEHYSDGPKSIVFQNGKLIGFKANGQYWDRMDNATDAPVIRIKDGRVTKTVELVPIGGGKVQEFVMETRTTSKDKKTVTTEYHVERSLDAEGYYFHPEGTKVVENKVNGITVKEKIYRANGKIRRVTDFKNGKEIETRTIGNDGKTNSINNGRELNWEKQGDLVALEIIDGNTNVWFGKALINGKITEIGFKTPRELELMDVMKRVDGKLRVDFGKLLEVDPNVKGLPRKVAGSNIKFSKTANLNQILEESMNVDAKKRFSDAQAKLRGKGFKFRGLVPPSAQDFIGLMYNFVGKGKQGEKHLEMLKKALVDPFARGVNELNTARQNSAEDYRNLLKEFPQVKKVLNKQIGDTAFTVDQAIRVYLWNKAGYDIPGLSARDLKTLDGFVNEEGSQDVKAFADGLGVVSKKSEGYSKPGEYWLVENIASDLMSDGAVGDARAEFLAEWIENKNIIFSSENLNKIEAIYGSNFREALEDILYRMETGSNRPTGSSRLMNMYMNWTNNSVGAIMFFNIRSAVLQTISATNYINWSDNNPLKAATALANFPQFIKDFVFIFNSDMLKQRRAGLKYNINEAELAAAVVNSDNKVKAILAWLLKKGFTPTQIADSFAISSGGATFYRNRVKSYVKKGMSKTEAEQQAWLDFQETTEVSQQSARPDLISQQQANPLGRLILAFQNTPMQYGRIMNKAFRDLANGRGDTKTHVSKIVYYGGIQAVIFTALQTALFAVIGTDDDDEKEKMIDKKSERMVNSMIDSWLSVFGYGGKAVSTVKNSIMEYNKQRAKDVDENFMTKSDHAYTLLQVLGFSPPIGSKLRKIYQSIQTEKWNRDLLKERGFTLDNPIWSMIGNVVEGVTNVPLGRLSNKLLNLDNAMDSRNELWQRAAMLLGWNTWDLGIKDPDIVALGEDIKERKKQEKKIESEKKKFEKKREKLEEKYPDKTEEEIEVIVKSKELFDLSKQQQIDLLKSLGVSDEDVKSLEKEKDRTSKIAELYKDNSKLIDNALETKTKPRIKTEKEKVVELSKELFDLSKQEQVDLLKSLDISDKEIKKLKKEKDRTDKIAELYKDNNKLIDDALKASETKPKEEKEKKKEVKLSKSEQHKKDLFKLKKKDQINKLMELGYPTRKIYSLRYEKDRVEMIIKLESKKSK